MKVIAALGLAALILTQTAFAAANPWLGTWKLNRDKSTFTGSTITAVKIPNGYHFDLGAVKYDVMEDGKDYPTVPNYTASLKPTGKNEWLIVHKANGQETSRTTMNLSSDGKTLTQTTTGTHADGTTYKSVSTDIRVGEGTGIAGTWKDVKESSSTSTVMMYSDAGGGKIKMEYPASKSVTVVSLDSKPAEETGPRAVPGQAIAFTKVSATELKYMVTMKGKPYVEGVETVSADGKVLKDVSWLVTKPAEKETEVYEKQ